jgi:hypothetical protein
MTRRALIVLAATAAAAALPGAADVGAATRHKVRTHHLQLNSMMVIVSSTGNPPAAGATAVESGPVLGTLGPGAVVFRGTWTALRTFNGPFQFFFTTGSLRGTQTGHGTVNADGSTSITGSGAVSSGSGSFHGARGSFTFTATLRNGTPVDSVIHASVSY